MIKEADSAFLLIVFIILFSKSIEYRVIVKRANFLERCGRQKRGVIHDRRNSLMDFAHQEPHLAGARVAAIGAGVRFLLIHAGERYEGAVDNADDGTDGDPVWRSQETVAPLWSAPALQQTYVLQFEENGLKEFGWCICLSRNMLDQHRTLPVLTRQDVERSQRVLAFSR